MAINKNTFHSSLLAAQKQVKILEKDSHNSFANYDYTSSESMISECKKALNDNGLVLDRRKQTIVYEGPEPTLRSVFSLTHVETGEERLYDFDLPICPMKGKPTDKAALGSSTTSLGYWLRDVLAVARGITLSERDDTGYNPPTTGTEENKNFDPFDPAQRSKFVSWCLNAGLQDETMRKKLAQKLEGYPWAKIRSEIENFSKEQS